MGTQSLAIIQYISETFEGDKMQSCYRSTEIAEIINSGIQPVQNLPILKMVAGYGGDKMEFGRETIEKGFNAIEKIMKTTAGSCCVGDEISVADLCLVPQIYNANRFSVDMKNYPTIK